MAEDQDLSQKTEEPTPKRLEDALKKGQVITSKEVNNFLNLVAFCIMLSWVYPYISKFTYSMLSNYIYSPNQFILGDKGIAIQELANKLVVDFLTILIIPFVVVFILAILSNIAQHGFIFSFELLKFDLSRVSPLKGMGRIFSLRSVVELIKGIIKVAIISAAIYIAIRPELKVLTHIYALSLAGFLTLLLDSLVKMMIAVCIVMAAIAGLDYFYQRYEYMKNMRMTKQEVKEEYKQTEGSPEVKSKLKELRREKAQKRMMAAVPAADVVITNPTHFAIALKYDQEQMPAPQVIAKGQDNIALKIKEIAIDNMIPVVENPPLARALFDAVEIDEYIPYEQYKAVAEVISYVMKLRGKKSV